MKVLVTGGAGFLGQGLCAALVERGYEVSSFQRSHSPELDAMGVRQIRGDLADAEAVRAAFAGQQAIFHNAAKAGAWGSYQSYFDANVRGTQNVLDACRAHGIARLVYTSTPSVTHSGRHAVEGGNELSTPYGSGFKAPYPATKLIAEKAVIAANDAQLSTVSLRPRLIWGPGDTQLLPRLVERARKGRLRFIDGGHNRMDTTYRDNAVLAHLLAFDALRPGAACAGKAYFISNGEPRPVREIVNSLLACAGEPPVQKAIPYGVAYAAGAVLEVFWRGLQLAGEPPMTRFLAEQLSTPHWYDISAAQRDFGYAPQVSTAEGLQRLRHWWQTQSG
ncbi:MAG TPA: 2-alkyl-3-oxoalkanoate reductase [Arenimonas sp.]|nr:2-alkyl-3-oxoalkanoate reductase [Arenimonas sp.]